MLDEMIDDPERVDKDEIMEKDKTEIELEKLVFGDESGFHDALRSYKDASIDLRDFVKGDRQQAQDGFEEGNLEGLNDADVCEVDLPLRLTFAHYSSSCFSSTPLRPL